MSPEESQRQFPRWEIIFALAYALGVVVVWSASGDSTAERVEASALLLVLAGWWWGFGRRLVLTGDDTSWRGVAYLLGVLALFAPAVALVHECAWVLFGLCPQPYMVRPHRAAIAWVGALNAVPPLVVLFSPDTTGLFWVQLAIAVGATAFSHIVGTSIERIAAQSQERAELIGELEASRAQVAALSREAGMTAERERLAAEIHDTLAQGFTSILTLVQAATSAAGEADGEDAERVRRHLDLAAETARENLAEARALVGALAPAALDTGSLAEVLRRQTKQVTDECGIAVEFDTDGELGQLSTPAQVVLLRAAQEALTNIRKHSGARSATVRLAHDERGVRLVVTDDGAGFDPTAPAPGFGLRGMRARAEQIGGVMLVDSGPAGTMLCVEVPA